MIPAGFIQDLLSRVDIVEVVSRHVELKRGGANFMGLCPFHAEKSPSFSVSPAKQFYHCFGCGASGDAIRFLTEQLGLSFVEAVRDLAQGAGVTVPEEQVSAEERERRDTLRQRRTSIAEVLQRAADFYRDALRAHPQAVAYLKRRGVSGTVAGRFGLGFAAPGWRTLAGVFARYDDPLLEEAGLVRLRLRDGDEAEDRERSSNLEGNAGNGQGDAPPVESHGGAVQPEQGRYDWFRNRVMFPIRSVDGAVIAFGGRVLDDSKPKYMNSPETPVFSKGRELYGLFEARQALREKGFALVVEGYMDVVALAQSGFENAVATLGTACTAEHVQKLFRFTDSLVFSFDGDPAGRRAAARALEAALPHATDLRTVRFLFLPAEHDPDSFVRERGAPAFEQAINNAVPLSRQLVQQAGEGCDLNTAEGRSRMLAQARPLWGALPEGALRRQMLPELARQSQLESADLVALWASPTTRTAPAQGGALRPAGAAVGSAGLVGSLMGAGRPRSTAVRAGRRPPAASADLALRLLLRHSDWWERLSADDHALLHALGGAHGAAVVWLERHLTEHGATTWAALVPAMQGEPWAAEARAWVDAAVADEEQRVDDLLRVMHRLWHAHLGAEVADLIDQGAEDRHQLERVAALRRRIDFHRSAERALSVST